MSGVLLCTEQLLPSSSQITNDEGNLYYLVRNIFNVKYILCTAILQRKFFKSTIKERNTWQHIIKQMSLFHNQTLRFIIVSWMFFAGVLHFVYRQCFLCISDIYYSESDYLSFSPISLSL